MECLPQQSHLEQSFGRQNKSVIKGKILVMLQRLEEVNSVWIIYFLASMNYL